MYLRFESCNGGWIVHNGAGKVATVTGQRGQWLASPAAGAELDRAVLAAVWDFCASRSKPGKREPQKRTADDSAAWLERLWCLGGDQRA